MAQLKLQLPDAHLALIAASVAATYNVEPTAAGVRSHLLQHLRQTVRDQARDIAADQAAEGLVFGADWGDLQEG